MNAPAGDPSEEMPHRLPAGLRHLREVALSGARAAAVRAAALLGVADALADEPSTVDELAERVEAKPAELRRLLRALAALGVFAAEPDGRYRHTEASRYLREDEPGSIKHIVLWSTEPWTWELWPRLDQAVRTGESVFGKVHDLAFFDYLRTEAPGSGEVMDKAMVQASSLSIESIADLLDLTGVTSFADICGGRGQVLTAVLARHPRLHGTLFDRPAALAKADPQLREGSEFAGRVELVAGDCRAAVPVRADAYLLKSVLDWDDESTVKTLSNVAAAARPGARVFIIENLADSSAEPAFTTAMDLLLLLNVGGRKRTAAEFSALAERSGLAVTGVEPVDSYLHLITCRVP
ncbi:methyltransferase [Amycolatopsis sp. VC5-11]|uniref:methyltransferase n=1 Tax=Amycolatopsis sp. VC5-11 TaxID=3120156 RepID=UPI00300AF923